MEYSLTIGGYWFVRRDDFGLNPYSNGILSDGDINIYIGAKGGVLILILMEYSLTIYQRAVYDFCTLIYSFCC